MAPFLLPKNRMSESRDQMMLFSFQDSADCTEETCSNCIGSTNGKGPSGEPIVGNGIALSSCAEGNLTQEMLIFYTRGHCK